MRQARIKEPAGGCKTLKQRFTQGYNRRHGRKGTLWERFKSLLVESSGAGGDGVSTVACLGRVIHRPPPGIAGVSLVCFATMLTGPE